MKPKMIRVVNLAPKAGNGEVVHFENAKCGKNIVRLTDYNIVYLNHCAN